MKRCETCQNFSLEFPTGMRSDYYKVAGFGRCTLESIAKVRGPNSGKECRKYQAKEKK